MTINAVIDFMRKTATDESCRQELVTLLGVGDGDISSVKELDLEEAEALKGERGVLIADFASKQGFQFTVADLVSVVEAFQRLQSSELSEAEFAKLLGQDAAQASSTSVPAVKKTVELAYRGIRYKSKPTANGAGKVQAVRFMEKTSQDDALRQELQAVLGAGDGDISSPAELDAGELEALKSERGALVAEFASKHGFQFTMADLAAVTDALQLVQDGKLSEQEFSHVLSLSESTGVLPTLKKVVDLTFKGLRYSGSVPVVGRDSTLEVVRFMEQSAANDALRAELQTIIGGDGDVSDPKQLDATEAQALKGTRGAQVAQLAAKNGYNFGVSDLSAVVGAFQLVQSGALSEESCVRILGLSGTTHAAASLPTIKKTATLMYRGIPYKG